MTEDARLEELDFDPIVTCDVRKSGHPCERLAALVIRGCCPNCTSQKPRDFLVCVPCWDSLARSMMTCAKCGTVRSGISFYSVIGGVS